MQVQLTSTCKTPEIKKLATDIVKKFHKLHGKEYTDLQQNLLDMVDEKKTVDLTQQQVLDKFAAFGETIAPLLEPPPVE